jgi:hypothetical protein
VHERIAADRIGRRDDQALLEKVFAAQPVLF